MKKLIFYSLLSIFLTAQAQEPLAFMDNSNALRTSNPSSAVTCVCQIGQEPVMQKWFFKKGCQMWLKEQTDCAEKKILDEDPVHRDGYKGINLAPEFQNGHLKLGYVGHWGGGIESYNYFKEVIIPTLKKYNVTISWDNTACSGLNNPEDVLKLAYIQSDYDYKSKIINYNYQIESLQIKLQFGKIRKEDPRVLANVASEIEKLKNNKPQPDPGYPVIYRANQVVSIGMWDRKVNPKSNLWAMVNFENREVLYPECSEFENQACTGAFQGGQGGKCRNTLGEIEEIICYKQSSQNYQWTLKKDCRE